MVELTRKQGALYRQWLFEFFCDNEDDVVLHWDNDDTRKMFLVDIGELEPEPVVHDYYY